jgi:hypothetical protein
MGKVKSLIAAIFLVQCAVSVAPAEFLREKRITDGCLPPYGFDGNGNVTGSKFQMQRVSKGKALLLEE